MSETVQAWGRIVGWLEEHAPVNAAVLRPGAAVEEIRAAEEEIGVAFPQDLKEFLLVNDGVRYAGDDSMCPHEDGFFLTSRWAPLSVRLIAEVYKTQMHIDGGEHSWWDAQWIPFLAEDDAAMYGHFVDARTGAVGVWRDYGEVETDVFPSLAAYFEHELSEMKRYVADHYGDLIAFSGGRLVYDP